MSFFDQVWGSQQNQPLASPAPQIQTHQPLPQGQQNSLISTAEQIAPTVAGVAGTAMGGPVGGALATATTEGIVGLLDTIRNIGKNNTRYT